MCSPLQDDQSFKPNFARPRIILLSAKVILNGHNIKENKVTWKDFILLHSCFTQSIDMSQGKLSR